jgi:hypothetical protein
MQLSDAVEVIEVAGIFGVNEKLAEGWTLLAVVPGADHAGRAQVTYVMGKPKPSAQPDPQKVDVVQRGFQTYIRD